MDTDKELKITSPGFPEPYLQQRCVWLVRVRQNCNDEADLKFQLFVCYYEFEIFVNCSIIS